MTVRLRLALTVFLTGLATAVGVLVAVTVAFQRYEHEDTWQRGDRFLARVVALHADLLQQQRADPQALHGLLRSLLLLEPANQLYLLDAQGRVLATSGRVAIGFQVALAPVQQAAAAAGSADRSQAAYVMGDDPEYMDRDAVVAARALRSVGAVAADGDLGYLYLVCRKPGLPAQRDELLRTGIGSRAWASVLAVCAFTTLLAAWVTVTVTRPLRVLSDEVAAAARAGFDAGDAAWPPQPAPSPAPGAANAVASHDEFGRLRAGFQMLLTRLRMQWDELRRLDRFRRESVSNLSHDLRSPLTATVACLETLAQRWRDDAAPGGDRDEDRRLVEVALRNTRHAAGMVRALGDLALLDEPEFKLHPMRLDLGEVLDDIGMRYAERAASQGVSLRFVQQGGEPPVAAVDVELFERAVANLLDNALQHTPAGRAVLLSAERQGAQVLVRVSDEGRGIAAADLPRLFDRLYRAVGSGAREGAGHGEPAAGAAGEEGKGLGLAIVKRIAELHRGTVAVSSTPGHGTVVTIGLPAG